MRLNNFLLFPYVNMNCVMIVKSNTYIRTCVVFGFNDGKLHSAQVNVLASLLLISCAVGACPTGVRGWWGPIQHEHWTYKRTSCPSDLLTTKHCLDLHQFGSSMTLGRPSGYFCIYCKMISFKNISELPFFCFSNLVSQS